MSGVCYMRTPKSHTMIERLRTCNCEGKFQIDDVKTLLGFYTSNEHIRLLDHGFFHPKFHWTSGIIEGIVTYAQYHWKVLEVRKIKGGVGPLAEYQSALKALQDDAKIGYTKRCADYKALGIAQKARDDLAAIKAMPPVTKLQEAVLEGCVYVAQLRCIHVKVYIYIYIYIHIFICIRIFMFIHIYIYI